MKRIPFENLIYLINDEINQKDFSQAYFDAKKLPPSGLTSNLIRDFQKSTIIQVKKDLKAIEQHEYKFIE